jgi:GMP synthase-like glutamine amidotransferase
MKKYGIFETGNVKSHLRQKYGSYPEMVKDLIGDQLPGSRFDTISVVNGDDLPVMTDYDGFIYMGSRFSVYDDLTWIEPVKQFIRDAAERSIPQVGICFGHQLMAEALGGKVEPKGWIVGAQSYSRDDCSEDSITAFAYHRDQVTQLPDNVEVILTNQHCPYAGLRYRDIPAYSVQFHPEFGPGFMGELIEMTAGNPVDEDVAASALASLERPLDRGVIAEKIARALLPLADQ